MSSASEGMVIWLLGLSGAGKSTLGRMLYSEFRAICRLCDLIDGDEIRSFFDHDLGYTKDERVENIKRIIYGAYLLSRNGSIVIVCNIAPFESLREFARRKIPEYIEIYLRKDLDACRKEKEVYGKNIGRTHLVGIDIPFEEPRNSDLIIDMGKCSAQDALPVIQSFLENKFPGRKLFSPTL